MLIRKDMHIHATAYNAAPHPDHTVANVVEQCRRDGVEYAGIVEHLNSSPKHPLHYIRQLVADFRELDLPDCFFVGVEADINADGTDSCGVENRRKFGLDYVIGSVHLNPGHYGRVEEYVEEEFRRLVLALRMNDCIDVIGHPWVQGIRWERNGSIPRWSFGMVPAEYQDRIIELAIENDKAIEVNNYAHITEGDVNYRRFLSKLLDAGVAVSVGSDAHDMGKIRVSIERLAVLEEMGFGDDQLWVPERKKGTAGIA